MEGQGKVTFTNTKCKAVHLTAPKPITKVVPEQTHNCTGKKKKLTEKKLMNSLAER